MIRRALEGATCEPFAFLDERGREVRQRCVCENCLRQQTPKELRELAAALERYASALERAKNG